MKVFFNNRYLEAIKYLFAIAFGMFIVLGAIVSLIILLASMGMILQ